MMDVKLRDLRESFDHRFALPPAAVEADRASFLGIAVGSDLYALRLEELAGLEPTRKIVPVPGARPALIGIAGIRGSILPIYSLPLLLGYADDSAEPRWLALCRPEDPVGLAFSSLEGFIQAARAEVGDAGNGGGARDHVRGVLKPSSRVSAIHAVVSIASILELISKPAAVAGPAKEP